ncbi:MAG: Gfo/Idh/MocA family oxidoreductase [Methanomassiliicoccus sp.]|nr:Gfo/Idh/MocA family oxidoreductase [Methanomassiliicoccus sp.]
MLRVGVIGTGSMGQNHARIYSEMGCLAGVFDVDAGAAGRISLRFGVKPYSDMDAMIAEVDAVSVCTPTQYHFDAAAKAISQGRSVLVEKPFTGEVEKARELCELAERKGVTIASGFVERFNPVVAATKDAIASGRFGKVVSIASRRVSSYPFRIRDVGVIMDLAIHDVDVIRYLTGESIESVYALGGKMANDRFEDHATLLLQTAGGSTGMVEVNWLTPMKVRKVSITCSDGYAVMDYMDQSLQFSTSRMDHVDTSNMASIPIELDTHQVYVRKEEPLKRELMSFIEAAEKGGRSECDGWNALQNVSICAAALRSMREGCRVKV